MVRRLLVWGVVLISQSHAQAEENVPLNSYPMIMVHDAGSGYLKTYKGLEELVLEWTMTQPAGFQEQLDCGARVFDARPAVNDNGELVWHHGDVVVNYSFVSSVNEVIEWCGDNQDELVLMSIDDCTGDGCNEAVTAALEDASVPYLTSCDWFSNTTLASTRGLAALSNGGQLLAINGGCGYGNYVPSVACSGYNKTNTLMRKFRDQISACLHQYNFSLGSYPLTQEHISVIKNCVEQYSDEYEKLKQDESIAKGAYRCYDDDPTHEFPINRMFDYLDSTSESYGPSLDGRLWQMQALWQETDESVVLGTLARSSLLEDEVRSSLNSKLTDAVEANRWSEISLLEVNNVCDGGPELFTALRTWWANKNQNK